MSNILFKGSGIQSGKEVIGQLVGDNLIQPQRGPMIRVTEESLCVMHEDIAIPVNVLKDILGTVNEEDVQHYSELLSSEQVLEKNMVNFEDPEDTLA